MTDYLEEHLGNARILLERVQQMEQGAPGLRSRTASGENVYKLDDLSAKMPDIDGDYEVVSKFRNRVYNTETEVNQIEKVVDNIDMSLFLKENGGEFNVNYEIEKDDNPRSTNQSDKASEGIEPGMQINVTQTAKRPPVSIQLEELDRAVSDSTALLPEAREPGRGGQSVFHSSPRVLTADSGAASAPDGEWTGLNPIVRTDSMYGGTQNWVEQADRIFRRDSRRYDGGFYLY